MFRRAFLTVLIGLLSSPSTFADEPLTPAKAATLVGLRVTVQFTVKGTGSNTGVEEIYSEPSWENKSCFFLRFPKKTMAKLQEQKIPSLGYYVGDVVRATGEVKEIDFGKAGKRAVIYIDDLSQFRAIPPQNPPYTKTSAYRQVAVKGCTVFVHPDVQSRPAEMKEAVAELENQLGKIQATVPKAKLETLAKVRFWLEWDQRQKPTAEPGGAAFHASAVWLKQNGFNPDKAGDVEISNARNFVAWSRREQPWMILHELAHAHHHLVLGEKHAGLLAAYNQAMERKLYESVDYVNGGKRKAYAATNAAEYYAELSEAYFGKNDFFPFTREQLKKHDPIGYKLMQDTWGAR